MSRTWRWICLVTVGSVVGNLCLAIHARSESRAASRTAGRAQDSPVTPAVPPATDDPPAAHADALQQLEDCESRTTQLRARAAGLRHSLRERLPAARIYELGPPNEVADRSLRPVVERILRGDGPALDHALECRDVVCRLTIIDGGLRLARVQTALQTDAELRSRVIGVTFPPEATSVDMSSKVPVREQRIYLRLHDSAGGSE